MNKDQSVSKSPEWVEMHAAACAAGQYAYTDPETGYRVFTALALQRQGTCCGAGCRHCPYEFANVPEPYRRRLLSS